MNFVHAVEGDVAYVTVGGLNEVKAYRTSDFTQVATIPLGNLPHGIWPSGDGSRVYVGFMEFLTPKGYLIEFGGCFSFCPPPVAWQRKFDVVARAIEAAIAGTRPGMVADDVVAIIRQTCTKGRVEIVGRRLWDFHGQGMHSLLRPFGLPGSQDQIAENMMINIHPGLLTDDGLGISATSNYIVTANGGRSLASFRHVWHVVGDG